MTRRRALVITDAFPVFSETFVVDHVKALASAGWSVTVVARELNREASREALHGFDVDLEQVPEVCLRSALSAVAWMLRTRKFLMNGFAWRCALHAARLRKSPVIRADWDLAHAHFANNGVQVAMIRPDLRTRLLVNFHGHDATSTPKRYGWGLYRHALGTADAVVHSGFIENRVRRHTSLQTHRVIMGVNLDRFHPPPKAGHWTTPLRLVCAGRLVSQKGQTAAIDAVHWLSQHRPDLQVRMQLIGDGPDSGRVLERIQDLGLQAHVEAVGTMAYSQIPGVFRSADVLLMPSQISSDGWQEGFCRTAVEGMACGLPVVACPSGALPDTVGDGGLVADGFDGPSVARALLKLIAARSPLEWSRRARSRAEQFSLHRMSDDYLRLSNIVADRV